MTRSRALVLTATCVAAALTVILSVSHVRSEYPRLTLRFSDPRVADRQFDEILEHIREAATRRDLEALNKFTGPAFFWEQDFTGDYDRKASAIPNLVIALELDDDALPAEARGAGWSRLIALATSRTRMRHPSRRGIVCVPGEASYADPAEARRTFRRTGTSGPENWGWVEWKVEVRSASQPTAETIAMLDDEAVRVLEWEMPTASGWAKVETSDGETGFVPTVDLRSWSPERLCFRRNADGAWQIAGYRGGD